MRLASAKRLRNATTALVVVCAGVGWLALRNGPLDASSHRGNGPAPLNAWVGAHLDANALPAYISVIGRDGQTLGFLRTRDVARRNPLIIDPVYGLDLATIIGHAYSSYGFVSSVATSTPTRCANRPTHTMLWCPAATEFVPEVREPASPTLLEFTGDNFAFATDREIAAEPEGQQIDLHPPPNAKYGVVSVLFIETANTA